MAPAQRTSRDAQHLRHAVEPMEWLDDASVLGELGERWGELERLGLALRPLSRGAGGSALLRSAGLPASRAQAGQREVHLLQALLIEVLGPFEDLPQPLGLLLHPGGALVLVMIAASVIAELRRRGRGHRRSHSNAPSSPGGRSGLTATSSSRLGYEAVALRG